MEQFDQKAMLFLQQELNGDNKYTNIMFIQNQHKGIDEIGRTESAEKTATNIYKENDDKINQMDIQPKIIQKQLVIEIFQELISIVNKIYPKVCDLQPLSKNDKVDQKYNKEQKVKKKESRLQKRIKQSDDTNYRIQFKKTNQHHESSHIPDLSYHLKKEVLDNYSVIMQYQVILNQLE